jgi:hypothetical protein
MKTWFNAHLSTTKQITQVVAAVMMEYTAFDIIP